MPISNKTLRDAEWKSVYRYIGATTGFETYACDALPGITITHNKVGSKRTTTIYRVHGKTTDSPIQAVRLYNEEEKRRAGGYQAAGSPKSS